MDKTSYSIQYLLCPVLETVSAFQVDVSGCDLVSCSPTSLYLCAGPDASLDYDAAITQVRMGCYCVHGGLAFFVYLLLEFLSNFYPYKIIYRHSSL